MSETDEPPTKENSLYLTITQQSFDEIVSGRKTVEYREIKDTTLSRYFYVPKKEGNFIDYINKYDEYVDEKNTEGNIGKQVE